MFEQQGDHDEGQHAGQTGDDEAEEVAADVRFFPILDFGFFHRVHLKENGMRLF